MLTLRLLSGLCMFLGLSLALRVCAQDTAFAAYMQYVAAKARSEGVSERAIGHLSGLTPSDRVIALDRDNVSTGGSSSSFPPLAPYLRDHNTTARINGGRRAYQRLMPVAADVE